jgi:FkbM family methyltransferase
MLIPVQILKNYFGVRPKSILHIGAHRAEELKDYEKNWAPFAQPIYWVEGQPLLVSELRKRADLVDHVIVEAFVWDVHGESLNFNMSTNSQSSSLLEFGTHLIKIPSISVENVIQVQTARLDQILPKAMVFEFINLDLQGVELQALKGLGNVISHSRWIYTEVNKEEVYKGCTKVTELDSYLKEFGFKRVVTKWVTGLGWGDALYIHKSLLKALVLKRIKFGIRTLGRFIKYRLANSD